MYWVEMLAVMSGCLGVGRGGFKKLNAHFFGAGITSVVTLLICRSQTLMRVSWEQLRWLSSSNQLTCILILSRHPCSFFYTSSYPVTLSITDVTHLRLSLVNLTGHSCSHSRQSYHRHSRILLGTHYISRCIQYHTNNVIQYKLIIRDLVLQTKKREV
jgi:hypothetical protein